MPPTIATGNLSPMLDKVKAALTAIASEGAFAAEVACGSDELHIEVEGVGPLRFPISATAARKLHAVARPAPFGKRAKTLFDPTVRDTGEIARSRIKIDARAWRRTLDAQLAVLAKRLGVPEGSQLVAELDKLLVYGPGQFFAPHQDSERSDDMVGTLVVELPSRHEGGLVVVQHHQEKKVFKGAARSPKDLSLLAFYADCHHAVQPVASGYRITLTYHLLVRRGPEDAAAPLPPGVDRLAAAVEAYFSTPVAEPYGKAPPARPDRLVYLLDHEYTQKSLGWRRLKNGDRLRIAALRKVAERLDAEVYLALADVHESWMCEDEEYGGRYGRRRRFEEQDDDGEGHTLVELIDTNIELRHWVAADGSAAPGISAAPSDSEVCFTRASVEMDPFQSEHEGYTGNAGNTVDRWYHRAAFMMWPRARNFVIRAKVDPSWAVKELASRIKAGAVDEARAGARELLGFWARAVHKEASAAFVRQLLGVLGSLGNAEIALGLLSPLGPHVLGPSSTPAFVALVERHGGAWGQKVFGAWSANARYDTPPWLSSLPGLCEALAAGGEHGKALAAWLLAREVASFETRHGDDLRAPAATWESRAMGRLDDLSALLETTAVLGAPAVRDTLVAFLATPATALPILAAGALLQKLREGREPAAVRSLGLCVLYHHVSGSLQAALAAPARSRSDWSITPPRDCKCALCAELSAFLRDRDRNRLAWPLAKERRQHIHGVIEHHRLPVTHVTTREGSPYTLVLTKTKALFDQDDAVRARQRALLDWIEPQRSAFCDEPAPAKRPARRRPG